MSKEKLERPVEVTRPHQSSKGDAEALAMPLRNPHPKLVLNPTQPSNGNQSTINSGSK
jgi:hypothetical protein